MKRQTTIRVRLTLLYAVTFFLAGAALVVLAYVYLGQSLDRQFSARISVAEQVQERFVEAPRPGLRVLPPDATVLREQIEQDRDDSLRAMLLWSLAALGVVGVVAASFGWLLAGRALHPLQHITATARRVADRSLHERIDLHGPNDEIKQLADTFDAMLERLDQSFDGQRRFVANASHELRTPLTINRTLIEVALDNPAAAEPLRQLGVTLLAVNERHERLIDGLLTLVSGEQRITATSRVDLADIARHVTRESSAAAGAAAVRIDLDAAAAPVAGDAVLLERLTQNLVDNAIRYNVAEDGWVKVATGTAGGHTRLTVENSGPAVPGYEVAGLFEPFRRLASQERVTEAGKPGPRGAGLGLSIVRSVATAHGGEVHATPREDGGLVVRVLLPSSD
ncbi:MAG: HAMP domain-containing protein [Actinophytocola sp.]|nr:HAMP domain-containing protein [Actinophytocola sp.]